MRTIPTIVCSCLVLLLGFSLILSADPAAATKDSAKPSWKISGKMEEACTCNAACPCWFGNKPTKTSCAGGETIFIDHGNYGKIKLDGLAIGQFLESPDNATMMESMGKFKFDHVYFDSKATPEQRDALKEIASHILPNVATKRVESFVPASLKIQGEEHQVTFGSDIMFTGKLMHALMGGAVPKISNPLLPDPIHKEYLQGEVSQLTYSDSDGNKINSQKSNYMYNTFTVTSEEYEKFEAEMAKMMQAQK